SWALARGCACPPRPKRAREADRRSEAFCADLCATVETPGMLPSGFERPHERRTEEERMWQADGWGWRARIGVLTAHAAIGPESEFRAMAPEGVSIHAARVPLGVMRPGGVMDPTIALEPVRAFADP